MTVLIIAVISLVLSIIGIATQAVATYWHWHDRFHRDTHLDTVAVKVTDKIHEEVIPALIAQLGDNDGEV